MSSYPKTMKALVAYGQHQYRLETDYPVPECADDEILIRTEACGICAGDLKCMRGAPLYWGGDGLPMLVRPPFIPGHEFLGRIVHVGANVTEFRVGDRVIAEQVVPCGKCRFCQTGNYWMCMTKYACFGFYKELNGGMAEYVRLPGNAHVFHVPEDMPMESALLIEPYACAKHAVDRGKILCEDTVVISGAGTLGLGMLTYARLRSPRRLIVIDMMQERLQKAKEFGADVLLNPQETDVVEEVRALTDGYGCDVYIEAAGHPSSVINGLNMIRKMGRFVEFGVFADATTVNWSIIGDRKELDIYGVHFSPYCYPFVIENIHSGRLETDGLIRKLYPIEKWEEAFDAASGKYGDYKIAVTMNELE